jgi:hypothetical protein
MNNTMLSTEPLFYGDGSQGTSAEDFIARLDALREAQAWTHEQTAKQAISYLRGSAHHWFTESMEMERRDDQEAAKGDFRIFTTFFKDQYFKIRASHDVTTDWSTLKQLQGERAQDFATRITAVLNIFQKHVATRPTRAAPRQLFAGIINTAITAGRADGYIIPAATATTVGNGMTTWGSEVMREGFTTILMEVSVKILANGLRHPALAEVVSKEERKGSDWTTIKNALGNAERGLTARKTAQNVLPKDTIPGLGKINSAEGDLEEGDVDAVQGPYHKQQQRGKAAAAKKQPKSKKETADERKKRNAGKFCNYCKMKDSHEEPQCFKKQRDTTASQSSVQQESLAFEDLTTFTADSNGHVSGNAAAGLSRPN